MNISRKNVARLASLTAVGAGVLAISPRAAEADILYTAENITLTPPSGSGINSRWIGVTSKFALAFSADRSSSAKTHKSSIHMSAGSVSNLSLGTIAKAVAAAGNTWNQIAQGGSASSVQIGSRKSYPTGRSSTNLVYRATSTNIPVEEPFYQLFKFTPTGGGTDYGWVSLNEGVNNNQLYLQINGLAYDNTGAVIPAGASPVPEPSPLILTGLGMLVLGAEGLRRFRAAKQAA